VVVKKYNSPENAASISQLSHIPACMFIFTVQPPTWNLEIIMRSRIMFIRTLIELIIRGISGLSRALVALEIATSMAELRAEKALMQM
jgi:hypothetical protein